MASLSELDDFDASTINDLSSKGLPLDSSNLSSIAEEKNNDLNCISSATGAGTEKMSGSAIGENAQKPKQSRIYTARHYSIGNVEKTYGMRKESSPYTSFCADETTDVSFFLKMI